MEYKQQTGKNISLNHSTVIRHANGGKPLNEFNAEKRFLSSKEEEMVLSFAGETAARVFPLSHCQLREHVNAILSARLGPSFAGVGEGWTNRFATQHSDHLKTIWSTSLVVISISKNDGSRPRNVLTRLVYHSIYSQIRNLFEISMATILVL